MKIWLVNHYAVPPQYYPLARPSLFAKNLMKMGHEVTIIAASTVHNSDMNMIQGSEKIKKETIDGIPYVFVKCVEYQGNGIKRVLNILEFAFKLRAVCESLEQPDVLIATSFDPISCWQAIRYAKKHHIKAIAEIADLWPETLVAYGKAGANHPVVRLLRAIEKKIYRDADAVVFTMEGAYDYIKEQEWENIIPREKVHCINNGIDLSEFDANSAAYEVPDADLLREDRFNVVYTGSIRAVNNLGILLDSAKKLSDPDIQILVWGDGDELEHLKERCETEQISNVIFKGKVEKKYIPYITKHADVNILHNTETPIMRFGLSLNKMFDYLAAGKPILVDFHGNYNPVLTNGAGIETRSNAPEDIAAGIERMAHMDPDERSRLGAQARMAAENYDFQKLTGDLNDLIRSLF